MPIPYRPRHGSALDPVDYLAAAGTATILAGETSTTITITIVDDNGPEPTENFLVNLSNPVNAPIVDDQAIVTINDSDVIGIPTLGQGAMALLGLLLAGLGFGSLRRRNIVS